MVGTRAQQPTFFDHAQADLSARRSSSKIRSRRRPGPPAPTWRPAPAQLARGVQLMQLRREDIVLVSEASHGWTAPFRNVHDPLWDDCHEWKREVLFREYRLAIESGRLPPRRDARSRLGSSVRVRPQNGGSRVVARGAAWRLAVRDAASALDPNGCWRRRRRRRRHIGSRQSCAYNKTSSASRG